MASVPMRGRFYRGDETFPWHECLTSREVPSLFIPGAILMVHDGFKCPACGLVSKWHEEIRQIDCNCGLRFEFIGAAFKVWRYK